ncbi:MAG: HepT-like ribonuclease domain-containing protein [Desulfococcaceae bacterium]
MIQYPEIDWKGAKGLRDIISHNYFRIEAEQIHFVCSCKPSPLRQIILQMISNIQSDI